MHVVLVRDLLEAGKSVVVVIRSLSDAVHDVQHFMICDAGAVERFDYGVALSDVFCDCVCTVCFRACVATMSSVGAAGPKNETGDRRNENLSSVFAD